MNLCQLQTLDRQIYTIEISTLGSSPIFPLLLTYYNALLTYIRSHLKTKILTLEEIKKSYSITLVPMKQFPPFYTVVTLLFTIFLSTMIQAQTVEDDFEGNGTISTWKADDCEMNTSLANPFAQGINTSATVLEYKDIGGQYANIRFEVDNTFDLSSNYTFSLKIYVPSNGLTGNQNNKLSLKLQDGTMASPWATQSEIIKPLVLDQWQIISFDFLNDNYFNLDPSSLPPTQRSDFNRVLLQVNGENNTDLVVAYIDDVFYDGSITSDPEFNDLVWSDEFDEDGPINALNWHHQTKLPSQGSWYNGEIQHYTNRIENSYVENGMLHLTGKKESFKDQGQTKQYTSARLNSKFAFTYGKIEVRAKLPTGPGTWPAIWTLGKNINEDGAYWDNLGFDSTSWPACGEMDIMEHWGTNQNWVSSATHTPSSSGNTMNVGSQNIPTASTDFHIYSLEWFPDKLVFRVDGVPHFNYQPAVLNADTWPFNAEQYILLNFAFLPSIEPSFTEDAMEIDYVRVYQNDNVSANVDNPRHLFKLKNAPNPAKDYTIISYTLLKKMEVQLSVHDVNGKLVQSLIDEKQAAGDHQVRWNLTNLSSGIYFYSLVIGEQTITEKIIIEK